MPSTPWSIMQSSTRRWPSTSTSPDGVNGVGAIGKIPANGLDWKGFTGKASGGSGRSWPNVNPAAQRPRWARPTGSDRSVSEL